MKNEEIVRSLYDVVHIEKHKRGVLSRTYYLVRVNRASMWLGEGETPAQAWKDAAEAALSRAKRVLNKKDNE